MHKWIPTLLILVAGAGFAIGRNLGDPWAYERAREERAAIVRSVVVAENSRRPGQPVDASDVVRDVEERIRTNRLNRAAAELRRVRDEPITPRSGGSGR